MRDRLLFLTPSWIKELNYGKFQFYHINEHYMSYSIFISVCNTIREQCVRMLELYSPSTASIMFPLNPQPNHVNIKGGGPVMKLDDGRLGLMGFNNMIPVIPFC